MEFSRKLGDLDDIRRYLGPGRKMRYTHVELFDAGNLDADSNLIDPDSPRAHSNKGNGLFHVDSSFNPRRASYSLLRGVVLPPPDAGGNTDFADSRAAWDDLPEELKTELLEKNYLGAHCMAHSRKQGSPEYFADLDPSTAPMSYHRIAQLHEPSGRMNLYVGAHLHHIEGVPAEKSAALIEALNNHTRQQKYIISVSWHNPGDMIIWDNRAVLHRAGEFRGRYKRDMRRTTVHDDGSYAWGENSVGTRMPGNESWTKPQLVQQMSGPTHTTMASN